MVHERPEQVTELITRDEELRLGVSEYITSSLYIRVEIREGERRIERSRHQPHADRREEGHHEALWLCDDEPYTVSWLDFTPLQRRCVTRGLNFKLGEAEGALSSTRILKRKRGLG